MRLSIAHLTQYRYDQPVSYALQQVRLTPKARPGQELVHWRTDIEGGHKEAEFLDQHNNLVTLIGLEPGCRELIVRTEGVVETSDMAGVAGVHGGFAPLWYFTRTTPLTRPGPLLRKLVRSLSSEHGDEISRLHALSQAIIALVRYETGQTEVATTVEEAIELGYGVCQDHAQIFISAARLMGYPARYVSGYLMMNDRIEQEATHAWAEVHVEGLGWLGFDASNQISPDERYVAVATGLDYTEAAPVSGMRFGNVGESMMVSLQVQQQ